MSSNEKEKITKKLVNKGYYLIKSLILFLKSKWKWVLCHKEGIMLFLSFFTVIFAFLTIQEAKESTKLAELNVNKTTEIAKWYYNPQPQLNIWTSVDYELNEYGYVYVDEWFDYTAGKGFNISEGTLLSGYYIKNISRFYRAPSYLACCKNIKISIYNSGRGSIIFPLISFDLEAKNKTNRILFKVHTVRTPIDKLEYNPELKLMFESHEFIENQKIMMPYRAMNDDFPPYLNENEKSCFVPPSFSKELLTYNQRRQYSFQREECIEILGPFRVGTIPPGKSVEIELKIFATESNCNEGILNITVQSLNTKTISKIINLKTGDWERCKRLEEFKRLGFLSE
jgi:hypothetical protein